MMITSSDYIFCLVSGIEIRRTITVCASNGQKQSIIGILHTFIRLCKCIMDRIEPYVYKHSLTSISFVPYQQCVVNIQHDMPAIRPMRRHATHQTTTSGKIGESKIVQLQYKIKYHPCYIRSFSSFQFVEFDNCVKC